MRAAISYILAACFCFVFSIGEALGKLYTKLCFLAHLATNSSIISKAPRRLVFGMQHTQDHLCEVPPEIKQF